jgi:hypothetical protein
MTAPTAIVTLGPAFCVAVTAVAGSSVDHPSFQCEEALRTFLDEQNDQREDEDLAEHGADLRFENLVGDAQAEGRQTLPASWPTPPSTTTRNESMM